VQAKSVGHFRTHYVAAGEVERDYPRLLRLKNWLRHAAAFRKAPSAYN